MPGKREVLPGLEVLAASRPAWLRRRRVGLMMHPASVTRRLVPARDVMSRLCGGGLKALFGPQHGISGEKQDNMIESAHAVDPELGIPIHSLYSETRRPTPRMLDSIDTLVVDLQDVGTRVYTFIWSLALVLEACAEAGKAIVVLDRPNPLGGTVVEGNGIRAGYESFVGMHSIPMRHGLTIGELALLLAARLGCRPGAPRCDLTVIPMRGWRRRMLFPETGLPWVPPSPNMPCFETTLVYPGQVLLEGTNLSEGRGTTRPFEFWGAPWLEPERVLRAVPSRRLKGAVHRLQDFQPTFHKWAGEVCHGFMVHVTDPQAYRPYLATLSWLQAIARIHAAEFAWSEPPYEYVTDRLPIDVLTGDPEVRQALESGEDLGRLATTWNAYIRKFRTESKPHLLYPT